jgi:hypothetical protein
MSAPRIETRRPSKRAGSRVIVTDLCCLSFRGRSENDSRVSPRPPTKFGDNPLKSQDTRKDMRLGFPSAGFGFPSNWFGFPSDWFGFPSVRLGFPSVRLGHCSSQPDGAAVPTFSFIVWRRRVRADAAFRPPRKSPGCAGRSTPRRRSSRSFRSQPPHGARATGCQRPQAGRIVRAAGVGVECLSVGVVAMPYWVFRTASVGHSGAPPLKGFPPCTFSKRENGIGLSNKCNPSTSQKSVAGVSSDSANGGRTAGFGCLPDLRPFSTAGTIAPSFPPHVMYPGLQSRCGGCDT